VLLYWLQHFKVKGDELVSSLAFNSNLHRYAKEEMLKRLGVDRVINYRREKVRAVLKAEFKQGVDLVYGRAVQVDLMKPMLKAPRTKCLKYDMMNRLQTLLSNSTCAATV